MAHIVGVPHFTEVPDAWKRPFGPYVKAPAEFGGDWYKVNPFTGPEPWKVHSSVEAKLPFGFEVIFGPRPKSEDFHDASDPSEAFRVAKDLWEQDLRYFKKAGPPEWATDEEQELAEDTAEFWDMGSPYFYEGRYGFMARFPEADPYTPFEATAWAVINFMHQEIAAYQIRLLQDGQFPDVQHPFVPPMLFGEVAE